MSLTQFLRSPWFILTAWIVLLFGAPTLLGSEPWHRVWAAELQTSVLPTNGAEVEYAYTDGFIEEITHSNGSGNLLRLTYARDNTGRVTGVVEERGAEIVTKGYEYDALSRLKITTYDDGQDVTTYRYHYDSSGNRTQAGIQLNSDTPTTTTYAYNSLNQLIDDGTYEHRYDELGRQVELYEDVGGSPKLARAFDWDAEDRLTAVRIYNTSTETLIKEIHYDYDDMGRLTRRKEDSEAAQRYLNDDVNPTGYSQTLAELNDSGTTLERSYHYGEELLAQHDSTLGEAWYHGDNLSTTKLLTDANGDAIAGSDFDYDPFGTPTAGSYTEAPYRFTGQRLDADTGLQNHRARWLNTGLANWMSIDPLFDFPANFGNAYAYAGNDPINQSDPSGMFSLVEVVSVVAIVAGLTLLDTYAGLRILRAHGADDEADFIVFLLKEVGYAALSFVPIIGHIINAVDMYNFVMWGVESFKYLLREHPLVATGILFGVALILVLSIIMPIFARLTKLVMRVAESYAHSGLGHVAVRTASAAGQGVLRMRRVRTIQRGEKIADIVEEIKRKTFQTGNEHAVIKLPSGERAIVVGGPGGISGIPEGSKIFGHTHPPGKPGVSQADIDALKALGQTRQYVLERGEMILVRPSGDMIHMAPPR